TYLSPQQIAQYRYAYDPGKARAIFARLGFKEVHGHLLAPNGKAVSLPIITTPGVPWWVAEAEVISAQLKQVGISAPVETEPGSTFTSQQTLGQFWLAINGNADMYPGPWLTNDPLYTAYAPVGQTAALDFERYHNARLTGLFEAYGRTANPATQRKLMGQISILVAQQLPILPIVGQDGKGGIVGGMYSTLHYVGWPGATNPYALAGNWNWPQNEVIVARLKPAR
ncbi:MAG: ABC transporter substrate-binding protein, partial [Thermaerobacter sp.]|nr:ABC transporter substrate-binding protein [Thermaerobacter sp.]